jgi:hypothetical protein
MEKNRDIGLQLKAEELEQTLNMQLSRLKQDTEGWVKIGGTVAAGAVAAFLITRLFTKKKSKKTDRVLLTLQREGLLDDEIKAKLTGSRPNTGFMSRMGSVLLPIVLNFGKEQIRQRLEQQQYQSLNERKPDSTIP